MKRIAFARRYMPVLSALELEFSESRPFDGLTIGICLHIEPKTGVLVRALVAGGARVAITGSPGTTQDDIRDALDLIPDVSVFGARSDGEKEHRENIASVLAHRPQLLLDNGADLFSGAIDADLPNGFLGGTEETTSGANRLRETMGGRFSFPILVINDSPLKRIIENEHGVGQTSVEAFMRITNLMVPARRFLVLGYGWCGRGIARTLKSLGGRVMVVDPDPIKALEATVDGMDVGTLDQSIAGAQVVFTATGRPNVLNESALSALADGAVLANVGHFGNEIDRDYLQNNSISVEAMGGSLEVFELDDGRRISLLAGGEMVNLAGGGGNPAETMDLGLTLQAFCLARVVAAAAGTGDALASGPQPVPADINDEVARRMLRQLGGDC